MTADMIEVRKARTTGVLSILIAVTALMNLTCGIIYSEQGGVDGSGIWSGTGVNRGQSNYFYVFLRKKPTCIISSELKQTFIAHPAQISEMYRQICFPSCFLIRQTFHRQRLLSSLRKTDSRDSLDFKNPI